MRILLQRVRRASVKIEDQEVASIAAGLLLLVGFGKNDSETDLKASIDKILNLRVFAAPEGKSGFDKSVKDIQGGVLVVSQFTLYANCNQGRRPGFSEALAPHDARSLYQNFCELLRSTYKDGPVAEGVFGADMKVNLENDGPVTIMLES
jgi:D-aminoacyl-tRNA deacylase